MTTYLTEFIFLAFSSTLVFVYAFWVIVTVASQFSTPNRLKFLYGWELIPRWTFFAPRPMQEDYYLLYRCLFADGSQSSWLTVNILSRNRTWEFIWNPLSHLQHAYTASVLGLLAGFGSESMDIRLNLGYINLLSLACSAASRQKFSPVKVRFLILRTSLPDNYDFKAIFLSEFHDVVEDTAT